MVRKIFVSTAGKGRKNAEFLIILIKKGGIMKRTNFIRPAVLALFFFLTGMGEAVAAWDGSSKTQPKTEKIDGKDFYLIESEENLAWFSDSIYRAGGRSSLNAKLERSLDMGGKLFLPIAAGKGDASFSGIFDGAGFTISNLYIDAAKLAEIPNPHCDSTKARCNAQNTAFIAVMSGGEVKNLNLDNVYYSASASAGDILVSRYPITVGGVVAWQTGGTVEGCYVSGTILTSGNGNSVGGMVGFVANGTIKNSLSTVSIYASGNGTYIGGLAGYIRDGVENIESSAYDGSHLVNTGDGKTGGIVGYFESGTANVDVAYFDSDAAEEGIGQKPDTLKVNGTMSSEADLNVDKVVCALNGGEFSDGACDTAGVWSVGENRIVVNGVTRNESGALVFVVSFDANGGVFKEGVKTSKMLKVNDKITDSEIIPPTRGDTVFAGWALSPGAETPDADLGVADRAKSVYAVWKEMFVVTFDANGSKFPDESTQMTKLVASGDSINLEGVNLPQNFTDAEEVKYYFSGWALTADATQEDVLKDIGVAAGNATLYAVWTEAPTFTVTYDTRGFGAYVDYVQEGGKTAAPDNPKVNGYSFVGWFTDSTFAEGSEYDFEKEVTENLTLYAKFNLVEYEIFYLMGKGANNEVNPISYTIETPTVKLQAPTRTGYVFDGWYYDKEFVNTATQITQGSTGTVKLYAKWEVQTFTITYMGGEYAFELVDPVTKTYGEAVTLKDTCYTREGYLQDGWSTEDGGKRVYKFGAEYTAEEDIVLYPHWVDDPTSIPSVASVSKARFGLTSHARTLEISGVNTGVEVSVFDIHGRTVVKKVADAPSLSIGVSMPGIYVVRVGMQAKRIAVR